LRRNLALLSLFFVGCTDSEPVVLPDDTGINYVDVDGDGVPAEFDCDDNNPLSYPGSPELCDGVDNNCNEVVDDNPVNAVAWFADVDQDHYGDPDSIEYVCHKDAVVNRVLNDLDCDDENEFKNPGQQEICDGLDNDCNDLVDENLPADAPIFYFDFDGDGFGDADQGVQACVAPSLDYVEDSTDCNDLNDEVYPGATERCDTLWDDDCDGVGNTPNAIGCLVFYLDADGDGYGTDDSQCLCNKGMGYTADSTDDCDDLVSAAHPGGLEECGDGVDQDCDGSDIFCTVIEADEADVQLAGEGWGDAAGNSVAGVGDVNQDGHNDVMVGAPHNANNAWGGGIGEAYIVLGPFTNGQSTDLGNTDVIRMTGPTAEDWTGATVASAGDLNGDDIPDVLIGAPGDPSNNVEGIAYVIHGPITTDKALLTTATATLVGHWQGDAAGSAVAGIGDADGDGFGDFLVSSPKHGTPPEGGTVYLISGPQAGTVALQDIEAQLQGVGVQDRLGWSADGAGDVDGDGLPDVIAGAPGNDTRGTDAGAAYVLLSPVTGAVSADQAEGFYKGVAAGDSAGQSVAGLGDIDGDGLSDFAIGAPFEASVGGDGGAVYVITDPVIEERSLKKADATIFAETNKGRVGWSIDSAGDYDGDGIDDLIIGAPHAAWQGRSLSGAAYLVFSPVDGAFDLTATGLKLGAVDQDSFFGFSVTGAGDVDGDGLDDLLVGAPGDDSATTDAGKAFIFFGQ
jgi:hypothetical protein